MAQVNGSYIYTGPWINWSQGLIRGSTITLSDRDGGLLVSFLSIFVTVVGAACWKLTSYALHQHRCRQDYQDPLHEQQQVVFRNDSTAVGAAWQMTGLIWYWRRNALRPLLRTLPFVLLALANVALFGVAGIFSSEVTKAAGNETLLRSPNCGFVNANANVAQGASNRSFTAQNAAALQQLTTDTLAASTYARACYGATQNVLLCNQFIKQQIPWTVNRNATCPFGEDLCMYGTTSAIELDSGQIDSHDMLGINAPKSERVQFRKVNTCSPIHTTGHRVLVNVTNSTLINFGDTLIEFDYGQVDGENYTYSYNVHSVNIGYGYTLTCYLAWAGLTNIWNTIQALNRTDADVSIFFLAANSVTYEVPVYDPMFAATQFDPTFNAYGPDRLLNVLACTDQYQFCNPTNGKCTPLTGENPVTSSLDSLGLNNAQANTAIRLGYSLLQMNTFYTVYSRGAASLRAQDTVAASNFLQIGLPPYQWQIEVENWYGVSMAKLQQQTVNYAAAPSYSDRGLTLTKPQNPAQEHMCKNQIVRSPHGTSSFSVLGIAIILIVGSIVIFLSLVLAPIMGFLRTRLHWKDYKALQWQMDEMLQLQRLAYEEDGQGVCSGGARSLPVTNKGDVLGMPEGLDSTHPRLGRVRPVWTQSAAGTGTRNNTPESESLMKGGMAYKVEPAPVEAHII